MKAIRGKHLIDVNGVSSDPIVLIEGNKIIEINSSKDGDVPENAELIDVPGLCLMPGLIDCHVHFTGSDTADITKFKEPYEIRLIKAALHQTQKLLESGITSVMDAGGLIGLYVQKAVSEGIVSGPRIMAAGRYISVTGGHGDTQYLPLEWVKEGHPFGWGMDGRIADGVDECIRAVREQLRMGADFIKICTSGGGGSTYDPAHIPEYTIEEIQSMAHIAHSWGRSVMAHCYNSEGIKRSVTGGVDLITHANMADEESIQLMKKHGTIVIPTMSVFPRISAHRAKTEAIPPTGNQLINKLMDSLYEDIRRLYDGGLTLAMGTDSMGGVLPFGGNAFELELYVEKVGLSPLETVKIGTINGAKAMGLDDQLGSLEKGKIADIIGIDGNPLDNIKILQEINNIKLVILDGNIVKKTD